MLVWQILLYVRVNKKEQPLVQKSVKIWQYFHHYTYIFYNKHWHLRSKAFFGPKETVKKNQKSTKVFFFDFAFVDFSDISLQLEKYRIWRKKQRRNFSPETKKFSQMLKKFKNKKARKFIYDYYIFKSFFHVIF